MLFENRPNKNIIPPKQESEKEEDNLIDESYPSEDGRRWIKLIEIENKSTIKQYYNNLGLTDEMLSGKNRILDIGAGMADFAAHCIKEDINKNIFSLEPNPQEGVGINEAWKMYLGENLHDELKSKTISGKMEEIPFKDESFDFIVANSAMPGFSFHSDEKDEMKKSVDKSFDEIIRVLKKDGEARLFPLEDRSNDPDDLRWKDWRKAIDEKLLGLKKNGICEIIIEDVVDLEEDSLVDRKRLIIKKISI